ncbi:MAG: sigma-70 family RNA polymerase sigma factor [Chitinophagales bacterium]|nr:sigma-70 family RNA polymerase sigma factor [Chitinophagales bacterium]
MTYRSLENLDDLSLVSKYKQTGDNHLVGILFTRYTHLVYGVCLKYLNSEEDSKDVTIEIFEKLLKDLKIHDIENFKAWLYSVAKNHCLMKFRSDKRRIELRPDLHEDLVNLMEWNAELHLEDKVNETRLSELDKAIRALNADQRICIELFYIQEKSYEQITEETGFTFKQVKSFIQNGKRNLKISLNKQS